MVVQPVANTNVLQLSKIASLQYSGGKLALPVSQNAVLFSRFKHVRGVPSPERGEGLPLASLRALDSVIDRLINIKGTRYYRTDINGLAKPEIDFLVKRYQGELHRTLQGVEANPSFGGASSDIGLALNIVA